MRLSLSCRATRKAHLVDNSCNARVKLLPKRRVAYQYWIPSLWRRRLSAHATLLCDGRRNSKLQLRVARLDSFVCWVVCAPQPRAYDCHEWLGGRAYPWTKRSPPRCASAPVHQCRYLQTLAEAGLGCVRGRLPFLEPEIRDVAKGTNGWTADVR